MNVKNTLIVAGCLCLVMLIIGCFIGWHIKPSTSPAPEAITQTDTVRLFLHDTLKVVKWQKGRAIVQAETLYYEDSTTISSLYALIAELSKPSQAIQTPTMPPPVVTQRRWGFGVVGGACLERRDWKAGPVVGCGIEFEKTELIPALGWGTTGWRPDRGYLLLRRRF